MGKELVQRLLPVLDKMEWPESPAITQFGVETYQMGMDYVDQYDGSLKVLQTAIKTFQSGNSRPYALAGVAYLLAQISQDPKQGADPDGLDSAMAWLEKAQADEPDRPDINFIEAQIYIYREEMENARLVLDYLQEQDPFSYRIHLTEAIYWRKLSDLDQMSHFYAEAAKQADTVPKRLQLAAQQGEAYFAAGDLRQALKHFDDAIYFNREKAILWHRKALIYWHLKDYPECKRCNDMTLKLRELPAAKRLQQELRKKMGTGGLFQRILGEN
ncbi:MAG: hypothetical protein AAF633_17335 [Chloroflexota bacterium]